MWTSLQTMTQKVFTRKELKMEAEGEEIFLEKTSLVLIRFSNNSTFANLYKKLPVYLSCFCKPFTFKFSFNEN